MNKLNYFIIIALTLILSFSSLALAQDYDEAPMLKERVENGELEPVEKRLPDNPYVVEPNEKIGRYGGTFNLITRYTSVCVGTAFVGGFVGFVEQGPNGSESITRLAESIEVSEDKTTFTINMREGLKWSDGVPFDAEDIMFWYNDILLNKDLYPVVPHYFTSEGEVMECNKLGDYKVEFKFNKPQPYFLKAPLIRANQAYALFSPKHYLKQFHPEYNSQEELEKKVEEAGFDNWWELFQDRNQSYNEVNSIPGAPTLGPWKTVKFNSSRHVFERNPYFWKVDPEGNQLPYVDRVETQVVTNPEVAQGKMVSGEVDFNGFLTKLSNYPMYKQYEEDGGYETILWTSGLSTETAYIFNLTSQEQALRDIFQDVRFRRAMSLAIDREEINNSLYFGRAKPIQHTVLPSSKHYKKEYAQTYIDYDPQRARELLDEMGLKDVDGDGWREDLNGEDLMLILEYTSEENPLRQGNAELVTEYWKEVGINIKLKLISGELWYQRIEGNSINVTLNDGWDASDIFFPIRSFWRKTEIGGDGGWQKWAQAWTQGREAEGEGSTFEKVKQFHEWHEEVIVTADDARRKELCANILESQAENLWSIGTVGEVPHAIIVDKNLHNVPKTGYWAGDTQWTMSRNPSQFFFDENEGKDGDK